MTSITYDMSLDVAFTINVPDAEWGRRWLKENLQTVEINAGLTPDGMGLVGEATLNGQATVGLIDGEEPEAAYESAARAMGWSNDPSGGFTNNGQAMHEDCDTWQDLCEGHGITVKLHDPVAVGDAALIGTINAKHKGKVWCFMAASHPHPRMDVHILGVAILGDPGWLPLREYEFADFRAAHDKADALNALLPYDEVTCISIVADTMARSRRKQEQEDGKSRFKVTVDSQRRTKLNDDDEDLICARIDELLEGLESPDGASFHIEVEAI